jgi:hypothetical protein
MPIKKSKYVLLQPSKTLSIMLSVPQAAGTSSSVLLGLPLRMAYENQMRRQIQELITLIVICLVGFAAFEFIRKCQADIGDNIQLHRIADSLEKMQDEKVFVVRNACPFFGK